MQLKKGFTLIELLVIISIIGLLSSVVLASLKTARERSRTVAIMSGALELAKSLELHHIQAGSYNGYIVPGQYFWDQPSDCKDGVNTYQNKEFISDEGARICQSILSNLMTDQPSIGDMSLGIPSDGSTFTIKVKLGDALNSHYAVPWFCVDNFGNRKNTSYSSNMNLSCANQPAF